MLEGCIYFAELNHRGAWTVYGSEGIKQYYGYTKAEALARYRGSCRTITNRSNRGNTLLTADKRKEQQENDT